MKWINSYARLGKLFYDRVDPTPVDDPFLFLWNSKLDSELLLSQELGLTEDALAAIFSGNTLATGSEPIATVYAGHQFGQFVPLLGDGRAHLLGEIVCRDGFSREIQLKGSGRTSFSRNGDGRCALGPAIREFIMSEAMHALGVPTTRCLSVVTSGEAVYRDQPQLGAVVTRIASSHLRVGNFEFFAARRNYPAVEKLTDYTIQKLYPQLLDSGQDRYKLLIESVIQRQIKLVVEWMRVGFIHGVMNTDNTTLSGETIDYGPCAMMDIYNPNTVFSSIDHNGRYSFANQSVMLQWNMARFAETLLPLVDKNEKKALSVITPLIAVIEDQFEEQFMQMMATKLGLQHYQNSDLSLISELLSLLEQKQLDYTQSFNLLTYSLSRSSEELKAMDAFGPWFKQWKQRVCHQTQDIELVQLQMRKANPVVIPRNHHMEETIKTCINTLDGSAAEKFLEVLDSPYEVKKYTNMYQDFPDNKGEEYQTFCGT
ncbi:MAG: YdiU family protein [Bacteroidetes bacterium]|nr:YdiU family protein [Bacteroidota bacterium]